MSYIEYSYLSIFCFDAFNRLSYFVTDESCFYKFFIIYGCFINDVWVYWSVYYFIYCFSYYYYLAVFLLFSIYWYFMMKLCNGYENIPISLLVNISVLFKSFIDKQFAPIIVVIFFKFLLSLDVSSL